jgi:hypothetical protein
MICGTATDSASLQFVFVSLAGWGSLIYGGYKFFTSGPKKPSASGPAPCPEGMERVPVKKH